MDAWKEHQEVVVTPLSCKIGRGRLRFKAMTRDQKGYNFTIIEGYVSSMEAYKSLSYWISQIAYSVAMQCEEKHLICEKLEINYDKNHDQNYDP